MLKAYVIVVLVAILGAGSVTRVSADPSAVTTAGGLLSMQGVGAATSQAFTNRTGAITVCWGMVDVEDPGSQLGPYLSLTAIGAGPQSTETAQVETVTQGGVTTTTEKSTTTTTKKSGGTNIITTEPPAADKDHGCKTVAMDPGLYAIHILATQWTAWAFTVTSA